MKLCLVVGLILWLKPDYFQKFVHNALPINRDNPVISAGWKAAAGA